MVAPALSAPANVKTRLRRAQRHHSRRSYEAAREHLRVLEQSILERDRRKDKGSVEDPVEMSGFITIEGLVSYMTNTAPGSSVGVAGAPVDVESVAGERPSALNVERIAPGSVDVSELNLSEGSETKEGIEESACGSPASVGGEAISSDGAATVVDFSRGGAASQAAADSLRDSVFALTGENEITAVSVTGVTKPGSVDSDSGPRIRGIKNNNDRWFCNANCFGVFHSPSGYHPMDVGSERLESWRATKRDLDVTSDPDKFCYLCHSDLRIEPVDRPIVMSTMSYATYLREYVNSASAAASSDKFDGPLSFEDGASWDPETGFSTSEGNLRVDLPLPCGAACELGVACDDVISGCVRGECSEVKGHSPLVGPSSDPQATHACQDCLRKTSLDYDSSSSDDHAIAPSNPVVSGKMCGNCTGAVTRMLQAQNEARTAELCEVREACASELCALQSKQEGEMSSLRSSLTPRIVGFGGKCPSCRDTFREKELLRDKFEAQSKFSFDTLRENDLLRDQVKAQSELALEVRSSRTRDFGRSNCYSDDSYSRQRLSAPHLMMMALLVTAVAYVFLVVFTTYMYQPTSESGILIDRNLLLQENIFLHSKITELRRRIAGD